MEKHLTVGMDVVGRRACFCNVQLCNSNASFNIETEIKKCFLDLFPIRSRLFPATGNEAAVEGKQAHPACVSQMSEKLLLFIFSEPTSFIPFWPHLEIPFNWYIVNLNIKSYFDLKLLNYQDCKDIYSPQNYSKLANLLQHGICSLELAGPMTSH